MDPPHTHTHAWSVALARAACRRDRGRPCAHVQACHRPMWGWGDARGPRGTVATVTSPLALRAPSGAPGWWAICAALPHSCVWLGHVCSWWLPPYRRTVLGGRGGVGRQAARTRTQDGGLLRQSDAYHHHVRVGMVRGHAACLCVRAIDLSGLRRPGTCTCADSLAIVSWGPRLSTGREAAAPREGGRGGVGGFPATALSALAVAGAAGRGDEECVTNEPQNRPVCQEPLSPYIYIYEGWPALQFPPYLGQAAPPPELALSPTHTPTHPSAPRPSCTTPLGAVSPSSGAVKRFLPSFLPQAPLAPPRPRSVGSGPQCCCHRFLPRLPFRARKPAQAPCSWTAAPLLGE